MACYVTVLVITIRPPGQAEEEIPLLPNMNGEFTRRGSTDGISTEQHCHPLPPVQIRRPPHCILIV